MFVEILFICFLIHAFAHMFVCLCPSEVLKDLECLDDEGLICMKGPQLGLALHVFFCEFVRLFLFTIYILPTL